MQYPASSYDAEVYQIGAGFGFLDLASGWAIRQFTNVPGVGEDFAALRRWWKQERHERLWCGFNSNSYDNHILKAVLDGQDDPAALYQLSCDRVADQEEWAHRLEDVDGAVMLDLLAMHGGKNAKLGSLKELGVKMGYPVLQELPFPYDAHLTVEQFRQVMDYNRHDLRITAMAAEASSEQIAARVELSIEMGTRVINKHDAGVAETIMRHVLFGTGKVEWPTATSWHLSGKELVQGFEFEHPALRDLKERISRWELDMKIVETPDD